MKTLSCLFFTMFLVAGSIINSKAATITGADLGVVSQMPGSATDFYMFGNFVATSASVLDDFTVNTLGNAAFGGDQFYSSIQLPTGGSPVLTGINFQHSPFSEPNNAPANMATFTLGNSLTFNYRNFDVFVLYSNADVPADEPPPGNEQTRDLAISVAVGADATIPSATLVSVSDINTDTSVGRIAEFQITGLRAGEEFTIAASPLGQAPAYLGGVSFEALPVPEPSTYAMMLAGLAVLGFCVRRRGFSMK